MRTSCRSGSGAPARGNCTSKRHCHGTIICNIVRRMELTLRTMSYRETLIKKRNAESRPRKIKLRQKMRTLSRHVRSPSLQHWTTKQKRMILTKAPMSFCSRPTGGSPLSAKSPMIVTSCNLEADPIIHTLLGQALAHKFRNFMPKIFP